MEGPGINRAAKWLRFTPGSPGPAAVLALAFAWAGCGGSGSSRSTCDPGGADSVAAFAAESALVTRGRADADFGHAFGADSQTLLDAADATRAALLQQLATEQGITLVPPAAPSSSCANGNVNATATVRSGAIFTQAASALFLSAGLLDLTVTHVPVSGMTRDSPLIKTETGTAADGSPTQTVTTIDTSMGGHDSTAVVSFKISTSITAGGKWTTEAATVNTTMNVCPDASGAALGTFDLTIDGAVGSGSTAASTYHGEVHDTFTFLVNDQAQVGSQVNTSAFTYHAMGARNAAASVSGTTTSGTGASGKSAAPVVTEDDGSAETAQLTGKCLFTFGIFTAALIKDDARSKWRGGTCVEVQVTPASMTVDANASVMVTATPRQKFEMADLNVPVVATLMGVASLSPANKPVMGPATFNYVAGGKPKDQGTVSLKSTSKRGIGTTSATYTVKCGDATAMMCPAGQTWNPDSCQCDCKKTCAANQILNPYACQCVCASCPVGQTLHPDTCGCTCDIDATLGNPSPSCMWVGSINVSSNNSGQRDEPNGNYDTRWTWSFSVDASLSVEIPFGINAGGRVGGSLAGGYREQEVDSYADPFMQCSATTDTVDDQLVNDFSTDSASVGPNGDGAFQVTVALPFTGLTGSTTVGADSCSGGDQQVDPSDLGLTGALGVGTGSGSSFAGTDPHARCFSGIVFPDFSAPTCTMSWDLKLVPVSPR